MLVKLMGVPSGLIVGAGLIVAVGGTFWTFTVKLLLSKPPSLSVTLTVTVGLLTSAQVCCWAPSGPVTAVLKIVSGVPSPQLMSTVHGLSRAGSAKEPRSSLV